MTKRIEISLNNEVILKRLIDLGISRAELSRILEYGSPNPVHSALNGENFTFRRWAKWAEVLDMDPRDMVKIEEIEVND